MKSQNVKVLLVCKGEYRYFFPGIACALQQHYGAAVAAIVFSTPAAEMLLKSGAFSSIFNLARHLKSEARKNCSTGLLNALRDLEMFPGATRLNTMIHSDRILSRYSHERILAILGAVSDFCDELLDSEPPDAIVGEVACASEWILWTKARERGIPYLIPCPTPVAKRFFFLDSPGGEWRSMKAAFVELEHRELPRELAQTAERFIQEFRMQRSKPPFLSWAEHSPLVPDLSRLIPRMGRIRFRVRSYIEDGECEIGSYHGTAPWRPVWEDSLRIWRHILAETFLLSREKHRNRPYAYFPLHVQPEFTTDVRAPFFTNQIALIEVISKCLPIGYELAVKEHPGMKGERSLRDYSAVRKFHNVRLLSSQLDSHELIRNCAVVLTITGSSAWEALLYEKPVISFGPLYYGFSDLTRQCKNMNDLPRVFSATLERFAPDRNQLLKLVAAFLRTAYELEWDDPVRQPKILEATNCAGAAQAIMAELFSRTAPERRELLPA